MNHNHVTRDIKPPGVCPGCDEHHARHVAEKDAHRCDVPGCDGTRLGHDLASEFPEETRRFDAAMDRLRGPREDRVMPENLHVIPPSKGDG